MKKRNYFFALAALGLILAGYFYSSEKNPGQPRKVAKPAQPKPKKVARVPLKIVPASKKDVPENINDIRSKQKLHLSAVYTALASIHSDYNRYSTDLLYMGYGDGGEIDFKIGFIKPYYPAELASTEHSYEDPERMTNELGIEDSSVTITDRAHAVDLAAFEHLCKKGCTANDKEFELMVVSPLANGKHDVWVINEKKEIVQVQDGTK